MSIEEELQHSVTTQGSEVGEKLRSSLGIELDPNMTILLDGAISRALPVFRTWAENNAAKAVAAGAKQFGYTKYAPTAAKWANTGVGYAIASLPQVFDVFGTLKDIGKKLNSDNERYKNILSIKKKSNLGFFSVLSYGVSDNSVLSELGSEYRDMFWSETKRIGVGSISAIPQWYLKSQKDRLDAIITPFRSEIDSAWSHEQHTTYQVNSADDENAKYINFALKHLSDLAQDGNEQAQKAIQETRKSLNPKASSFVNDYGTIIAKIGTGFAQKSMMKNNRSGDGERTIDLIAELAEQVKNNPESEEFEVGGKIRSLQGCIEYLFQYNQKRRGNKLLPEHRLSEIASQIADALKDDECPLKPEALAYLIGDSKGERIIQDAKKGMLSNDEQVQKAIDNLSQLCNKEADASYDPKTFESETGIKQQFMKAFLEGIKDDPNELAKFAALFKSGLLMKELGLTRKEVKALCRQGHKAMVSAISESILELSNLGQNELKGMGFTEADIKFVRATAVKIEDRGEEEVANLLHGEDARKLKNVTAKYQITSWVGKVEQERSSERENDRKELSDMGVRGEDADDIHNEMSRKSRHAQKHKKHHSHRESVDKNDDSPVLSK